MAFGQLPIPFYSTYVARKQQNDDNAMRELGQLGAVTQVFGQLRAQQDTQELENALKQSGGDPEKAMQAALKVGNVKAAATLEPLVKLQQNRRDQDETSKALMALYGPSGSASVGPTTQPNPMIPGPGASIMAGAPGTMPPLQPAPAAPSAAERRAARIDELKKTSLLYTRNPAVFSSYQKEIDRLQELNDKESSAGTWSEPYQLGGATVQKNTVTGQIRTAVARPPVGATTDTEAPAGPSQQYRTDPVYRKKVDFWAKFLADGGSLPPRFAQSGSGKKMMRDIVDVVPTLGSGNPRDVLASQVDITGQKSQARAVGTRSAAVEMAAGEAREMMPLLIQTSENFKRTGYQPINRVIKSYQDNTGSPESRQFGAALNTFINVYARAISPSGVPTVADKEHAREVLSSADSHEQLVSILKVLDQEMTAAQHAPARVRQRQREAITSGGGEAAPAPSAGPLPATNAKGWRLMIDAKGNRAYVGPNREVEEVR